MTLVLDKLPILILEQIIGYLGYQELLSISRTSKFFQQIVFNQVNQELSLPRPNVRELSKKELKKAVLKLNIYLDFDTENITRNNENVKALDKQLNIFNLTKVGEVEIRINHENDRLFHDVIRYDKIISMMAQ